MFVRWQSMLELQRMKLDLAELSLGTNEGKAADQMKLRLEVSPSRE